MVATFNELYPQILEIRSRFQDDNTDVEIQIESKSLLSDEGNKALNEDSKPFSH